jgi:uncharacterized membrane protein YqjE
MNDSTSTSPLVNIGLNQIFPALKILLEAAVHRAEIATLELTVAREQALATTMVGLAAFALILLGGFTASFTLAALVWDLPNRALILGLAGLGCFLGAGLLIWIVASRLRSWHPLKETCQQLRSDRVCLQDVLGTASE